MMLCPHCQKEISEGYDAPVCPYCQKDLSSPPKQLAIPETRPEPDRPYKIYWPVFFLILLTPPAISFAALLIGPKSGQLGMVAGLGGGAIAGFVCGSMLGLWIGRTPGMRLLLCFVLSPIMLIISFLFCFVGCTAGGFPRHY